MRTAQDLTKDEIHWLKYEKVRRSGEYNMIMQCSEAAKAAHLTIDAYSNICKRYSFIKSNLEKDFTQKEIDNYIDML